MNALHAQSSDFMCNSMLLPGDGLAQRKRDHLAVGGVRSNLGYGYVTRA